MVKHQHINYKGGENVKEKPEGAKPNIDVKPSIENDADLRIKNAERLAIDGERDGDGVNTPN